MGNGRNGGEKPYINGNGFDSLKDFKITPPDPEQSKEVEGVLPSAEQQQVQDAHEAEKTGNWTELISDDVLLQVKEIIDEADNQDVVARAEEGYDAADFWNNPLGDIESLLPDDVFDDAEFKRIRSLAGKDSQKVLDLIEAFRQLVAERGSRLSALQSSAEKAAAGGQVEPAPGPQAEAGAPKETESAEQEKAVRDFISLLTAKQSKKPIRSLDDKVQNFEEALLEESAKSNMPEDVLLAVLYEMSHHQREYEEVVRALGNMDAAARRRQLVGQLITLLDQAYGTPAARQEAVEPGQKAEILQQGEKYIITPGERGGRRMVADFPAADGSVRFSIPLPEAMNLDTPDEANNYYNFVFEFLMANVTPGDPGETQRLTREQFQKLAKAWQSRRPSQAHPAPAKPVTLRPMAPAPAAPKPIPAGEAAKEKFDAANEIYIEANPKVFKIPQGTIGVFVNEGVGRDYQEDRAVINSEKLAFASIDGIGGHKRGSDAAHIMAEELHRGFNEGTSFEVIQDRAHARMKGAGIDSGGACYIAARIEGKELKGAQAGDVRLFVIRNGKVVFTTKDQGKLNEVSNCVAGNMRGETTPFNFNLEPGDRIIAASDGLTDILENDEIAKRVNYKNTQEALDALLAEAIHWMKNGYKKDNINVVIFDYNPVQPPAPEPAPAAGPKKLVPGKVTTPAHSAAPKVPAPARVEAVGREADQVEKQRIEQLFNQVYLAVCQAYEAVTKGRDPRDKLQHARGMQKIWREQAANISGRFSKEVQQLIQSKGEFIRQKQEQLDAELEEKRKLRDERKTNGKKKQKYDTGSIPPELHQLVVGNSLSPEKVLQYCREQGLDAVGMLQQTLADARCPEELIEAASTDPHPEERLCQLLETVMSTRSMMFAARLGRDGDRMDEAEAKYKDDPYQGIGLRVARRWEEELSKPKTESRKPEPHPALEPPKPPKPPEARKERAENSGVLPNRAQYEILPARSRLEIDLPANASLTETIAQLLQEHPELISQFGGTNNTAEAAQKWFVEYAASHGKRGDKAVEFDRSASRLVVSLVGGKAKVSQFFSARILKPKIS